MNYFTSKEKSIIKLLFLAGLIFLIIRYFDQIVGGIGNLLNVMSPVIIGCVLAYVLNIPMEAIEERFFPNSQNPKVQAMRRPIALLLAVIVLLFILVLIINLVLPQLIGVIGTIIEALPDFLAYIQELVQENDKIFPSLGSTIESWNYDWQGLADSAVEYFNSISANLIGYTITTLSSLVIFVINSFLSLMIAITILLTKEVLAKQFNLLSETYLSEAHHKQLMYIIYTTDHSFSHYLVGEMIYAIIMGVLVTVSMWMFGFLYAEMIGALSGVSSLIPYLGSYISGTIGFILIFVQSPNQAIWFIIYYMVLQQIAGNILYPRIVGGSIGLPALWVLVSVSIGGGLWGVVGMLLIVPVVSTLYRLLQTDVNFRRKGIIKQPAEILMDEIAKTPEEEKDEMVDEMMDKFVE